MSKLANPVNMLKYGQVYKWLIAKLIKLKKWFFDTKFMTNYIKYTKFTKRHVILRG